MESLSNQPHRIRFIFKWVGIAATLVVLYILAFYYLIDKRPFVEWTLIKSRPEETRPQAQLIKLPDGKVFLLEPGTDFGSLLFYLKKQKIKNIDSLIIISDAPASRAGIKALADSGIRIDQIVVLRSLETPAVLYDNQNTRLSRLSFESGATGLKLIHGTNRLILILQDEDKSQSAASKVNCGEFNVDVFLNYSDNSSWDKFLTDCSSSAANLSNEKGTFKILFKGDSFKWKRGR